MAAPDADAWQEWILNAPAGALEVDLSKPGQDCSHSRWADERDAIRICEPVTSASAIVKQESAFKNEGTGEEGVDEEGVKKEETKEEEPDIKME